MDEGGSLLENQDLQIADPKTKHQTLQVIHRFERALNTLSNVDITTCSCFSEGLLYIQ